ncbi:Imidazolonepropionase [Frankliniella fusca]|uniref:Imidazolonepropionase n=1 Tax=Frankliniella fusca TaxID=407009 RepID=A0AAE1LH09_9NEOP|nr:Imidazolonepropionase [Frankliniella fusca]
MKRNIIFIHICFIGNLNVIQSFILIKGPNRKKARFHSRWSEVRCSTHTKF